MTVQEWLGEDNKLGIDIWDRKYRYNNETFDEWLDRVSGGDQELRKIISERKFLFGGRTLANRNTGKSGSMSNCYSRGFCQDSLEDLMQTATDIAHTFKAQGGQGISLSHIRPKGTGIHNGQFKSDGIIPFMEIFNRVTESISQGGSRKGALLMSLDAWHKEAEDFIKIKSEEGKIQKANLSLEIDDDFMECVKKYYETGEVITKTIEKEYDGNKIEYEVTPIELYKLMMEKAWDWGEPGCLFVSQFRNYNLMEFVDEYQIETCNPCFSGDEELLTTSGFIKFKDLDGKEVEIYDIYGNPSKSKVWCSGEKETITLKLSNRDSIICTPDHKFMTINGSECFAKDMKNQYLMPLLFVNNPNIDKRYLKLGFIQGDGELHGLITHKMDCMIVDIGEKDTDIFDLFSDEHYTIYSGDKSLRCIQLYGYNNIVRELGFSLQNLPDRLFPSSYDSWSYNQKASFLQGCYSANGCVVTKYRVQYKTTCREFAEKLVQTLKDDFNIDSYITTNKPKKIQFPNGEYEVRESYDVCIQQYNSLIKFATQIGFYHNYKKIALSKLLQDRAIKVTSVNKNGIQKVYDFTEPNTHWGIVNGFIVHNCGEQPLIKHGACNLGSINLSEFVKKSFTDKAYFDFEDFKEATRIAIIALDKVLDENKNNHALPEQREMAVKYRNVGLGITGAYDALVRMGIRYGSKQSVDFMDALMGCMFRVAVITSSKLAEEYGTFPGYKPEVLNSKIILKHFTSEELDLLGIRKNGLRNCSLLSIAPAGSIGTMLDVSTGCEPAFSISYKRKTESLNDGEDKYYDVYVGVAKQYLKMYPNRNLPSYFVTAADINWKDRINMQSALQKHVDTAISSTVNLNHDISIEEVEKLYLYAWQKKLKGVTIFRDGCKRVGILTTDNSDQVNEEVPKKLERGMIIVADENVIGKTRKLTTGCGNLWVRADFDPDTGDLIHCWLDKGSQGGCTSNYQGISRMISLAARGGIDIYSIVDQLKSVYTCPSYASRNVKKHDCSKGSSCPSAIGNALMDMYQEMQEELFDDGDDFEPSPQKVVEVKHENSRMKLPKQKSGAKCPECGHDIIFVGQCISCPECGWSKCE